MLNLNRSRLLLTNKKERVDKINQILLKMSSLPYCLTVKGRHAIIPLLIGSAATATVFILNHSNLLLTDMLEKVDNINSSRPRLEVNARLLSYGKPLMSIFSIARLLA